MSRTKLTNEDIQDIIVSLSMLQNKYYEGNFSEEYKKSQIERIQYQIDLLNKIREENLDKN